MNRRPNTQLPALRSTRDDLPEPAGPHFLSKGRSAPSNLATQGQGGGALCRPERALGRPDPTRIEITFTIHAAASDRPRPEIKCIAKLPGGFESFAYDYAPTSFSPDEMADFLAGLEAKARKNLEWVVSNTLDNLKRALGAE